jgi:uncharacterized protein YndB with AHSA1/START domain
MATIAVTPDQDGIVGEIFVAAPPERVFEAITDPRQMPLWWGQKEMYRISEWKNDLRKGGKWSSVGMGTNGTAFRVDGEYLEIDPPRLLVHTWVSSWGGSLTTVVRWELEPQKIHGLQSRGPQKAGTGTVVRIRHDGFAGAPKEAMDHYKGWVRILEWMQAYVEEGKTVDTR